MLGAFTAGLYRSACLPLYNSSWPLLVYSTWIQSWSLVPLQNTAHPVNGIYHTPDNSSMSMDSSQASSKDVQQQGEWRKLHNAELHALYSSPDIIKNIKSRRLRWEGHVARMGESRSACSMLVGMPRRRWDDSIKMDLREVGYDGVHVSTLGCEVLHEEEDEDEDEEDEDYQTGIEVGAECLETRRQGPVATAAARPSLTSCELSSGYETGNDTDNKLAKFQMICGTIHKTLRQKTRKDTRLKFYKTIAVPVLLYGSESWVTNKRSLSRIQSVEMNFLRRTKGCTKLDHIRNGKIRRELEILYAVNDKIQQHRVGWEQHVQRMEETRLPKIACQYKPRGLRDVGRPRKIWKESL
ncbi:hypothetical protein ANN_23375 [Periplaneta americana]|uniref:Uncharacterized protein n=1 Tax=Periplaneta americana TaxID=6978 RepID=A0ABQ8SKX2_PERAM|nr:hypothetical protein ANN_23375 [Periplaneta americana]